MRKLGLAVMVGVLATSAFAEVKKTKAETNEKNKVQKKQDLDKFKRVVLDESMANREGKKYSVNAILTGISFGSGSAGIEAGYHLDTNTVVGLEFHSLSGLDDDQDSTFYEDRKGQAISLSLKKFTSNSFYIKPAIYHRTQNHIESGWRSYSSTTDKWTVSSRNSTEFTDMGVSFTIGNQWQWENFTLGCNWVGLSRSLSVLDKKDTNDGAPVAQNDLSSGQLLNFYMGYTF